MTIDRITFNPSRMNGQASIRDMRLTVRRVIKLLALYPDRQELELDYPDLEEEDIRQALLYAANLAESREGCGYKNVPAKKRTSCGRTVWKVVPSIEHEAENRLSFTFSQQQHTLN